MSTERVRIRVREYVQAASAVDKGANGRLAPDQGTREKIHKSTLFKVARQFDNFTALGRLFTKL